MSPRNFALLIGANRESRDVIWTKDFAQFFGLDDSLLDGLLNVCTPEGSHRRQLAHVLNDSYSIALLFGRAYAFGWGEVTGAIVVQGRENFLCSTTVRRPRSAVSVDSSSTSSA